MYDGYEYMVSIICETYNHAPYVRQCIEGFLMQKTDFAIEILIHDDASSDGTPDIIREYAEKHPDLFKPIYQVENQYSKGVNIWHDIQFPRARGKYIAICEGDDYWTDPLKLQKQVEFLEKNSEYVLCFCDVLYYNCSRERKKGNIGLLSRRQNEAIESVEDKKSLFYAVLLSEIMIPTLTMLYRRSVYEQIIENKKRFMMGDTLLALDLSQLGRFKYINSIVGVYNIHAGSLTHDESKRVAFNVSMYEMRIYYCEKYGYDVPKRIKRKYNRYYVDYLYANGKNNANTEFLYDVFADTKIKKWYYNLLFKSKFCRVVRAYLLKVTDFVENKVRVCFLLLYNFIP